jgi:hypothetical protein
MLVCLSFALYPSLIFAGQGCGNGTAHIRNQCTETAVLSCHRFLINSGVEKMNNLYSYLETSSGGQSFNLYINIVHFFNSRVN